MAVTARNDYLTEAQLEVMKSFSAGWDSYMPRYQEVFNITTDPSRLEEKFSVRGGMTSAFVATTEQGAYNNQNPQIIGTQTITELIFKEQVAITKMMKKKDNYGSAMSDAKRLGLKARIKMDKLGADLLADASGATVTWDGLPLASASHLVGNTGTTQSNLVSGGLNITNIETVIQNFGLQKDHDGDIMGLSAVTAIVPQRNWATIKKLFGSPMSPEDANRNINPVYELGMKILVWPQLVTTDFEVMFLGPDVMRRLEYLIHYGPDMTPDRDTNTGNDLVQLDLACNAGAVDYLGTYFITS